MLSNAKMAVEPKADTRPIILNESSVIVAIPTPITMGSNDT